MVTIIILRSAQQQQWGKKSVSQSVLFRIPTLKLLNYYRRTFRCSGWGLHSLIIDSPELTVVGSPQGIPSIAHKRVGPFRFVCFLRLPHDRRPRSETYRIYDRIRHTSVRIGLFEETDKNYTRESKVLLLPEGSLCTAWYRNILRSNKKKSYDCIFLWHLPRAQLLNYIFI